MRFKKIHDFILMEVGKTQNGLELDRETIKLSVAHRGELFDTNEYNA